MSMWSAGPSWRTISYVSLYKFSKEAQQDIFRQLRASPGCGSSTCYYDKDEHIFEIACLADESQRNLTTLVNLVVGHTEQQLNLAEVSDIEPNVSAITAAFVHEDTFERVEPSEIDPEEGEIEDSAPPLCWRPRDIQTDLTLVASKENLAALERLTGCQLALDEFSSSVLISRANNDTAGGIFDRLDAIEKEMNRHVEIEHIPHLDRDPQTRVRLFCLGKLKDGSLGRILIPTDWCPQQDELDIKVLTKAWIICLMVYDLSKQEFLHVKRSVRAPVIPTQLAELDVWAGFEFRNIGQEAPAIAVPEVNPGQEELELCTDSDKEDEPIENWRDSVQPGTPPSPHEQDVEPSNTTWSSTIPLQRQSSNSEPLQDNQTNIAVESSWKGERKALDWETWKSLSMMGNASTSSRVEPSPRTYGHHSNPAAKGVVQSRANSSRGRGSKPHVSQSRDKTQPNSNQQRGYQQGRSHALSRSRRGERYISSSNRFQSIAPDEQLIDIDEPAIQSQADDEMKSTILISESETKLVDDSIVELEEDIEKRIYISTKKKRPGPARRGEKHDDSTQKALNSLKSEFKTSKEAWVKPSSPKKGQSSRKDVIWSQKSKSSSESDTEGWHNSSKYHCVNKKLLKCVSNTLEKARTFRGRIKIEVQIGQILLLGEPNKVYRGVDGTDFAELTDGPLKVKGFETPPENFTKAITSSASDILALLNILGVAQQKAYSREAVWELICKTSDKREVRILIDAETSADRPKAVMHEKTLGACYLHALGRVHDARLMISGATVIEHMSTVPGAEDITKSIFVERQSKTAAAGTDKSKQGCDEDFASDLNIFDEHETCTMPSLMGRDGELHVDAVRLRSKLWYQVKAPGHDGKYQVELVRVADLPIDRPHLGVVENAGIFRARALSDETLVAFQRLWYEVNLRELYRPPQFDQNEELDLGGEAEWQYAQVVDEKSLLGLEMLTRDLLDKMDCIGFGNRGPGFVEEQRMAYAKVRKAAERPADVFW